MMDHLCKLGKTMYKWGGVKRRPILKRTPITYRPRIERLEDLTLLSVMAMMDSFNVVHDRVLNGSSVLVNDSLMMNPGPLTASLVSAPSQGGFTFNTDGTFVYTPPASFTGSTTFVYKASANGEWSNATVSINVTNFAPSLMGQTVSLSHDRTKSVNLLAYATDADGAGETLTAIIVTAPSHGTLTLVSGGTYLYTPTALWVGTDSATVKVSDGAATSAAVTFTFNTTNATPTIGSQQFSVGHGQEQIFNPLANALDADGDSLVAAYSGPTGQGTFTANTDGTWTYHAPLTWVGTAAFNLYANDGIITSSAGTLTVQVTNQAPLAYTDEYTTTHDQPLDVEAWNGVLASDTDAGGDPLTAILAQGPQHGTLTLHSDGGFLYTPNANYAGIDSFTYYAHDGVAQSGAATVTLHVANEAPVAQADHFYLHAGLLLSLDATSGLMHNDYDPGNDALTAQQVGANPAHGTLVFNTDGSFTYQANAGFVGDDFFSYRLSDGVTYSNTVMVTIHVENETPEPSADSFDVWSLSSLSGPDANVLLNDQDADNDTLTASLLIGPSYAASFALNADGSVSYVPTTTPPQNWNGEDFFTYKTFDGTSYSNPITASLHVTATPLAKDDGYILDASGVLTVYPPDGVLKNEFNPMNVQLTAQLVQAMAPNDGSVVFNADGSFVFTQGPNWTGVAVFSYGLQGGVPGAVTWVYIYAMEAIRSKVGLWAVDFASNADIRADISNASYRNNEWLDMNVDGIAWPPNDHQLPISFTRNTRIGMDVSFKIDNASLAFWRASRTGVRVKATGPNGLTLGGNLGLPLSSLIVGNNGSMLDFNRILMDNPLPNVTAYYNSFELNWQISPDSGLTWLTPTTASTSRNEAFVTLENPNGWDGLTARPTIKHTVFFAAIGPSSGSSNEADLVTYVHHKFAHRTMTRADGTAMKYYGQWNTAARTAPALIQGADGQCDSWARFFIDVLRAQGGDFTYADNAKGIRHPNPRGILNYWGFLVKDWNLVDAANTPGTNIPAGADWNVPRGLGYTHANEVAMHNNLPINQNAYSWVGGNAAAGFTDQSGIPGQNSPNPQSLFQNHAVVQIGNTLYDPSYGAYYAWTANNPLGDFQTKAIAGIVGLFPNRVTGRFYIVARTPAANEMNQLFLLNPL